MAPRLATMSQVTQEMRAIYREARAGQFEGGWAACETAMRCLDRLRFALAASDLEARLDALERHLNLRDARGSTANDRVRANPPNTVVPSIAGLLDPADSLITTTARCEIPN